MGTVFGKLGEAYPWIKAIENKHGWTIMEYNTRHKDLGTLAPCHVTFVASTKGGAKLRYEGTETCFKIDFPEAYETYEKEDKPK